MFRHCIPCSGTKPQFLVFLICISGMGKRRKTGLFLSFFKKIQSLWNNLRNDVLNLLNNLQNNPQNKLWNNLQNNLQSKSPIFQHFLVKDRRSLRCDTWPKTWNFLIVAHSGGGHIKGGPCQLTVDRQVRYHCAWQKSTWRHFRSLLQNF